MHLWRCLPHKWLSPLFLLLLLLLFVLQCTSKHIQSNTTLSRRCERLNSTKMTRICNGRYPIQLLWNYEDNLVGHNNHYAVFSFDDRPDHHFFTFKKSGLMKCKKLEVVTPINFACILDQDYGGGTEPKEDDIIVMSIKEGMMYCLDFHYSLADALIEACHGPLKVPSAFCVFHYANKELGHPIPYFSGGSLGALHSMICAFAFTATMFTVIWMQIL